MKKLRLAGKIITTLIKDQWHYRSRLIADLVLMFVRCGILLVLYSYVFRLKGDVIHGANFVTVAWSIFFYFALSTLRLRDVARLIMQDVQSGAVETIFTKPISYIFYRMMWQIGAGISSFVVAFIAGSVALLFFVGAPETMFVGIFVPSFIITFFAAVVLNLILYVIIGFISFWIEDINPIFWLVDKTIMILGGAFFPVALFPDFLYKMAIWSPFGAAQFITHTVNASWQYQWYMLVGMQIMWICVAGFILFWVSKRAQKRVSINGG